MNSNQVLAQAPPVTFRQPDPRWVASLQTSAPADRTGYARWEQVGTAQARGLYLTGETGCALPIYARAAGVTVVLDGNLYNRPELLEELSDVPPVVRDDDAAVILAGYQRWGEDVLRRLRGAFALLVWDSSAEVLLCLRDPLGSYPMFYAEQREGLVISTAIRMLISQPDVSPALNRASLVDHLLDRYPRLDETSYEAVRRVPPGHVLRVARDGRRTYRYWDPAPDGEVKWLAPEEVERFDDLLERAVSRCLSVGPAGIFLSGGLDSVSVAAVAVERSRAEGLPVPWALSLDFPDPLANEEMVQRGVATQLGLPHVVKPFFEATGPEGLLGPALALSSSLSAPLMNTWLPAYYQLALEGKRRGCRGILTGGGGDEWLTVSPYLAADLIRNRDVAGLYRLWQSMRHSFKRSSFALGRSLLWTFGAQPLLLPPVHRFFKAFAPWALKLRHRVSPWPAPWVPPVWLAPDTELRRQFDQRREEEHINRKPPSDSVYLREIRPALDHAVISWEAEELFEVYQQAGVRMLHPFWDPDIVDMLYRTPPFQLLRDGFNKSLVRATVARRFPKLGFERQRKVEATTFYASQIYRSAGAAWQQCEGATTLADLGIIDKARLRPVIDGLLDGRQEGRKAHRVWTVLNLESWARAHVS
jgi:asparagine synthetase B (glutamine-hydrolysing)